MCMRMKEQVSEQRAARTQVGEAAVGPTGRAAAPGVAAGVLRDPAIM